MKTRAKGDMCGIGSFDDVGVNIGVAEISQVHWIQVSVALVLVLVPVILV